MATKQVKKVKKATKSKLKKKVAKKSVAKKGSVKKLTSKKATSKKAKASSTKTSSSKPKKKESTKKTVAKKTAPKKKTTAKKLEPKKTISKKKTVLKSAPKASKSSPKKTAIPKKKIEKSSVKKSSKKSKKNRYNAKELAFFKNLIDEKLLEAQKQLAFYLGQIKSMGTNPDNKVKGLEDGTTTSENEKIYALAARQRKYIHHLENANLRIKNKIYGVCRVTGNLISKARLKAVPHATLSINAKLRS